MDPLVRGMDQRIRIRIHTKISWIRNSVICTFLQNNLCVQRNVAIPGRLSRGDEEQHPALRLLLPGDGLHLLVPRTEPRLAPARHDDRAATDGRRLPRLYLAPALTSQHDLIKVRFLIIFIKFLRFWDKNSNPTNKQGCGSGCVF